jgi:hypothetical protein
MTGAWMSKGDTGQSAGATQTAHFVDDGAPLCAKAVNNNGTRTLAPFLCTWVPLRDFDRKCQVCRSMVRSPTAYRGPRP